PWNGVEHSPEPGLDTIPQSRPINGAEPLDNASPQAIPVNAGNGVPHMIRRITEIRQRTIVVTGNEQIPCSFEVIHAEQDIRDEPAKAREYPDQTNQRCREGISTSPTCELVGITEPPSGINGPLQGIPAEFEHGIKESVNKLPEILTRTVGMEQPSRQRAKHDDQEANSSDD